MIASADTSLKTPPGDALMEPPSQGELYRQMQRIRRFEETVLERFPLGEFYGTTHTYIGQEADAVGVLTWLEEGDIVVSNHRCHGHFLAYGGSMHALAAELMGRSTGVSGGRGGSQHVQWRNFYANGILGGTIPLAVGMALAEKQAGHGRIVIAFMGDGTLGEGVVYESLNLASLWETPILFVLENNRYAQSTPITHNLAGSIEGRFAAFGIQAQTVEATDVLPVLEAAERSLRFVRSGSRPAALILETYRFAPHSKGDDVRDPQEIAGYRERDPLVLHAGRLVGEERDRIEAEVEQEVQEAFEQAGRDPHAEPATLGVALDGMP
jgi:TPP-dependent pyruvate/acetoin dehydrogenase alpha subunit